MGHYQWVAKGSNSFPLYKTFIHAAWCKWEPHVANRLLVAVFVEGCVSSPSQVESQATKSFPVFINMWPLALIPGTLCGMPCSSLPGLRPVGDLTLLCCPSCWDWPHGFRTTLYRSIPSHMSFLWPRIIFQAFLNSRNIFKKYNYQDFTTN